MISNNLTKVEIENWLRETDPEKLELLWQAAVATRDKYVGKVVHLRGLLEISNHCVRKCTYCGINKNRHEIPHYRMSAAEILAGVKIIAELGYGTVVIQAGEDYGLTQEFITNIIHKIKLTTKLAVTLSLGERPIADLRAWLDAGANRYLLRFETSDEELYRLIHPALSSNEKPLQRFAILKQLKALDYYEVGSGVMVGIPGQTYKILANDIAQFRDLDLDMIGVGPYISSPETALGRGLIKTPVVGSEQVSATELMTCKVIALTRLVCPEANIPSTTALATINLTNGRELGLRSGANVLMPNITPVQYKTQYEIYPHKAGSIETPQSCAADIRNRIKAMGYEIGSGPGGRRRAR